jgi:O-antigen ligase
MTQSLDRQPNPMLKAAFPLLLFFLFYIFSGLMEKIPYLGTVRPQLVMATFGLLAVFGTGQFMKVLYSPIGKWIAIFSVWFVVCGAFGVWPGGSFAVLMEYWYKSALIFLMTAGLLITLPQANRVYRTIAYAVGILSVVTLVLNTRSAEGRLVLANSRYDNPNDLAWTLLTGLVFVGFLYSRGTRNQKIVAVLMVPSILLAMSRTGSRAVMLATAIFIAIMLMQAKRKTRIRILVGAPVVLLAALVMLPKDVRDRYTTIFGTYDKYTQDVSELRRMATIGSAEMRKQLLIDSLVITGHHPLMGVGPGNFQVAQNDLALGRGDVKGAWHVTHNSYTEVSSETGVTGLIIYLGILYNVFKVLNSIVRSRYPGLPWQNLRHLARTLRIAFIVFLPVAFFSAMSYHADMPILAGLAAALGFMAQKQRAIDRAASAQTAPAERLLKPGFEPVAVGQY